jgi:hypothetical protein
MIYLLATLLGLIASVGTLISGITWSNIRHVENGRQPNAGAALFPAIPTIPLLFVGVAWILQILIPESALLLLLGSFVILSVFWALSFAKLKAELERAIANSRSDQPKQP